MVLSNSCKRKVACIFFEDSDEEPIDVFYLEDTSFGICVSVLEGYKGNRNVGKYFFPWHTISKIKYYENI